MAKPSSNPTRPLENSPFIGGFPITTPFFKRGSKDVKKCHVCFSQDFSGTFLCSDPTYRTKNSSSSAESQPFSPVFGRQFPLSTRGWLARLVLGVGWDWSRWLGMSCFFRLLHPEMMLGTKWCDWVPSKISAGGSQKNCFQGTTWKAKAEADDYSHPSWSPGFDFPSWGGLTTTGGTLWEVGSWIIPTKWGPRLR